MTFDKVIYITIYFLIFVSFCNIKSIMLKYHKHNSKTLFQFVGDMCAYLDVFGIPPTFRIMKKVKFTTPIGLLFTFVICVIVIVYLLLQLEELIN